MPCRHLECLKFEEHQEMALLTWASALSLTSPVTVGLTVWATAWKPREDCENLGDTLLEPLERVGQGCRGWGVMGPISIQVRKRGREIWDVTINILLLVPRCWEACLKKVGADQWCLFSRAHEFLDVWMAIFSNSFQPNYSWQCVYFHFCPLTFLSPEC